MNLSQTFRDLEPDLDDEQLKEILLADKEALQAENNDDGQEEIDDVHIDLGSVDFNQDMAKIVREMEAFVIVEENELDEE